MANQTRQAPRRRRCAVMGATAGLAISSLRLGRAAIISLALVAGAGAYISGGTFERIPLRAGRCYRLSRSRMLQSTTMHPKGALRPRRQHESLVP